MGQTLSNAARWTSARGGAVGKLEYTEINESILNNVVKFVESFQSQHDGESKIVFKKPLSWETELTPSSFSGPFDNT